MISSENCHKLIMASEGCRLTAYQDSVGVWTIGYGHTKGVGAGMTCTPVQAASWLADDLHLSEYGVNCHVSVMIDQNQFDALCDFVFNLGIGALSGSTLLRLLNEGETAAAANEFPKWCHAGGKVLPGLVTRRAREQALFLGDPNFMEKG